MLPTDKMDEMTLTDGIHRVWTLLVLARAYDFLFLARWGLGGGGLKEGRKKKEKGRAPDHLLCLE